MTKIRVQPVDVGRQESYGGDQPVMAAEAWDGGPVKPRHALREREVPPRDVSLDRLSELFDWVEVLPGREVRSLAAARELARTEPDLYVVEPRTTAEVGPLLAALTRGRTPAVGAWDDWGFSWWGRFFRGWGKVLGFPTYVPVGGGDVETLLRAVRARRVVRDTRVLYIGDVPSHSVNADTDPLSLYRRFGVELHRIGMDQYVEAVRGADPERVGAIAAEWLERYEVIDDRAPVIERFAAVFVALGDLLRSHGANALTVDCAFLPDVDLVPCVAASLLIDEGIAYGCEGDTGQLLVQQILGGVSGTSALMGNLFENATHQDVLDDVVVINHDVLPPSMCDAVQTIKLRDFHAVAKGSTLIADLPHERVTMGGLSFDSRTLWLSAGEVVWAADTTHCRLSVGIKVADAKRIFRDALGHHQVFTYGGYLGAARLAGELLGLEVDIL